MHDEVEARETQAAALVCYWRVGAVWHRRAWQRCYYASEVVRLRGAVAVAQLGHGSVMVGAEQVRRR